MPFSNDDQTRLVKVLKLERQQLFSGSRLKSLMTTVETLDQTEGTDLANQIQVLSIELSALDDELETNLGSGLQGIKSERQVGWFDVEYADGAGASTGKSRQRDSKEQRLRTLLDPDNVLRGVTAGGNILF